MLFKCACGALLLCQESGQVKQTKSYQLTSLRSETRDLLYNFQSHPEKDIRSDYEF